MEKTPEKRSKTVPLQINLCSGISQISKRNGFRWSGTRQPEFISQRRRGAPVLLTKDESVSIMINEEDHLRIQAMCEGLILKALYRWPTCLIPWVNEKPELCFDQISLDT